MPKLTDSSRKMNVAFINPFISAIGNVLETMAMLDDIRPGKPLVKQDDSSLGDVTGVIDMNGMPVCGSFAISFSKSLIEKIYHRMLGEEVSEIDDQVKDLVGEITNMVGGGAKKTLCERGYTFGMASPHVVSGDQHQVKHNVFGPKIVVPFQTSFGEFFIETSFQGAKC